MELVGITESIQQLVTQFTGEVTSAAPVVAGAVVLVAGVRIGFKWIKRLAGSIG